MVMQRTLSDNGESGYLENVTEPVSSEFTRVETLHNGEVTVTSCAVRYGRRYFLKSLRREVAGESMYRQMLGKEFNILMRLSHPAVVQSVGFEDVPPLGTCIVTEWIDGVTLDRWLEERPGRAAQRSVVLQLLDAVEHVHSCGVVHRDIKPANVMVTGNGAGVKLIDFGLADTAAHVTLKQPAGTAGYMAPEQRQGRVADPRNDIYSLGAVMRQMDLGRAWQRVAARCLLPADERPQDVNALREALLATDRLKRRLTRAAAIAMVCMLSVAVALLAADTLQRRHDNTRLAAEGDSLRAAVTRLTSQQADQRRSLRVMTDSLHAAIAVNDTLRLAEQRRSDHERLKAQAVEQGKRLVDKAMASSAIVRQLDTLSCVLYIDRNYGKQFIVSSNQINEYVATLDADLGESDRSEINNLLTQYLYDKWINPIKNRISQMPALPNQR